MESDVYVEPNLRVFADDVDVDVDVDEQKLHNNPKIHKVVWVDPSA